MTDRPTIAENDRVVVHDLSKQFGNVLAVQDVNLRVKVGEVMVIVGPSGSGKSTVLRCMNHLEVPTRGSVFIDGVHLEDSKTNINEVRREVGMVFQQFNLFPHMTVLDNLTLAQQKVRGRPQKEAEEIAMAQLERVGIPEQAGKKPSSAVRRAAAAGGDRTFIGDEPQGDAFRRAHLGPRSRDDQGSA